MVKNDKPLILLDRDGVINYDSDDYIKTPDEWQPIPSSLEAIARLTDHGYRIFVITNQSGIGRGLYTEQTMHLIHATMLETIERSGGFIESIYYCPHHPDEMCECRKPATGMLHRLREEKGVSLRGVPFVGDTMKDVKAALSIEAVPKLVLTGKGEREVAEVKKQYPEVEIFADLLAVTEQILG